MSSPIDPAARHTAAASLPASQLVASRWAWARANCESCRRPSHGPVHASSGPLPPARRQLARKHFPAHLEQPKVPSGDQTAIFGDVKSRLLEFSTDRARPRLRVPFIVFYIRSSETWLPACVFHLLIIELIRLLVGLRALAPPPPTPSGRLGIQVWTIVMAPSQPLAPDCFCFSMKFIKPNYEVQSRLVSDPPDALWQPPTDPKAFVQLTDPKWYYWHRGTVSEVPLNRANQVTPYKTTSMFWGSDRQAFLQIPVDCTEVAAGKAKGGSKKNTPVDWAKITFYHVPGQTRCLSLIGYGYENNQLGATGSPSWMPQLLPAVYQYEGPAQHAGTCQLAGDLSVLLGLAAFSVSPQTEIKTIGELLCRTARGTEWRVHSQASGRNHERGIVVSIGIDPQISASANHLSDWEAGKYGPILL